MNVCVDVLKCILIGRFRKTFFQTAKLFYFKFTYMHCFHIDYLISHWVDIDVNPIKETENHSFWYQYCFLRKFFPNWSHRYFSIHPTKSLKLVAQITFIFYRSFSILKRDKLDKLYKLYEYIINQYIVEFHKGSWGLDWV